VSRICVAFLAIAVLAGCGGGNETTLRVSAAASLKNAFEDYGGSFEDADVSFSFAGSDELAAQIRKGARPDVFASANTKLPMQLRDEGLTVGPGVVAFAVNRLVVAVPKDGEKVRSLENLDDDGVRLAAGSPSVPVGSYAREIVARLGPRRADAIERNIRSNEPDVSGVVGKVSQGAVDAGFVYATDVRASGGRLKAIELPERIQSNVLLAAVVVKGTDHPNAALAFIQGLLTGSGRRALQEAGFGSPGH
jgi:molybdate transport system substrate-binding protein